MSSKKGNAAPVPNAGTISSMSQRASTDPRGSSLVAASLAATSANAAPLRSSPRRPSQQPTPPRSHTAAPHASQPCIASRSTQRAIAPALPKPSLRELADRGFAFDDAKKAKLDAIERQTEWVRQGALWGKDVMMIHFILRISYCVSYRVPNRVPNRAQSRFKPCSV